MKSKPETIDDYLAGEHQAAQCVGEVAPRHSRCARAEEYIGCGLAGFKFNERPLVYFGVGEALRFTPRVRPFRKSFKRNSKTLSKSKGTIKFTPRDPCLSRW